MRKPRELKGDKKNNKIRLLHQNIAGILNKIDTIDNSMVSILFEVFWIVIFGKFY